MPSGEDAFWFERTLHCNEDTDEWSEARDGPTDARQGAPLRQGESELSFTEKTA